MAAQKRKRRKKKHDKAIPVLVGIVIILLICIVVLLVMNFAPDYLKNDEKNDEQKTEQTQQVRKFTMPDVLGKTREEMREALSTLRNEGFVIEEVFEHDETLESGIVISQKPKSGTIREGQKIIVTINLGEETVVVEDCTLMKENDAVKALERQGLVVHISQEMSDEVDEGEVIRQLPTGGQEVETGTSVRLFISSGPNMFELDDYEGVNVQDAKYELEAMGIEVEIHEEHSDVVGNGAIIEQIPAPGAEMKKGDEIILYVSIGEEMVQVPNIIGLSVEQARELLSNSGLHLGEVTEVTSETTVGTVVRQSIVAGSEVEKDTIVDVYIAKATEETTQTSDDSRAYSDTGL